MKPKKQRQEEAEERQKARAHRTPQQQLDHLDKLLGIGQGAMKERFRLQEKIALEEMKHERRRK